MNDDWISPDYRPPPPPARPPRTWRGGLARVGRTAASSAAHIVSLEDRPRLEALMSDESAPAAVKVLASLILHFTHRPTERDRKTLGALLQHACNK